MTQFSIELVLSYIPLLCTLTAINKQYDSSLVYCSWLFW